MKNGFIGVLFLIISCFRTFSQSTHHTSFSKYINAPDSTFNWTLSQRIDDPEGILVINSTLCS